MYRIVTFLLISISMFASFPEFEVLSTWMPPVPEGPVNGSSVGRSMAFLGDVNGDGFDDLALASELACDTSSGEVAGKVYIYFGHFGMAALNELPDVILTGEYNEDWFGYDVSGGDFNGDGYNDIAVLAYRGDKAYIYWGGDPMDSVPDLNISLGSTESFRGQMDFVGDLNGDTYQDLAIPMRVDGDDFVFIYHGGVGADLVPDDTITGYGYKVGYGGDIDNDGYDDLLIGDPYAASDSGRVYIFHGADPFEPIPAETLSGVRIDHDFGWNSAIIGDLNSDGFDDIGVIASGTSSWIWKQCWMYWGSDSGHYEYAGYVEDDVRQLYGTCITGAGDINYDGYDDFIVGAPGANIVDHEPGHVHIYYGGEVAPESSDVFLVGEAGNDQFGLCIAAGGNINNDDYNDLAIGAFKSHQPGYFAGKVYIYSGKDLARSIFENGDELEGQPARGWGGYVLASGDINDDGFGDVAFTHELRNRSEVYLCLGSNVDMNLEPDFVLGDSLDNTRFGNDISFGDFDGDGIDDMAIGIPYIDRSPDTTYTDEGQVRIFFGSDPFYPVPGFILNGPTKEKKFGYSVAFIGDLNGDGADELLVGSPEYIHGGYADSTGYAYLYFGGSLADTIPDMIYKGEEAKSGFGAEVCGPGDMNGDGIPDYIISSHRLSWPGGFGKVYVYEGNPTPVDSPVVIWEDPSYEWIGQKVKGVGDLNGDGLKDVLVNCRSREWGSYGEGNGAARIYIGGSEFPEDPYVEITAPPGCTGGFGVGIGELGDINWDGYDDFAIGAPNGIPGEWMTAGAIAVVGHDGSDEIYVFFGGDPLDGVFDRELIPSKGHEMFGYDICSAGMTSWDSSPDILIGAPGNSMSGYETGKVYLLSSTHTEISETKSKPAEYSLNAYPNPFNASVKIEFTCANKYLVEIFDIQGRKLFSESGETNGKKQLIWKASDFSGQSLASGVYYLKITTGQKELNEKLMLIK